MGYFGLVSASCVNVQTTVKQVYLNHHMAFMHARIKLDFHSDILDNQSCYCDQFFLMDNFLAYILMEKVILQKKQVIDQKVENLFNSS